MINYTLGFLFNSDLSQVVLIQKTHPVTQCGLFNGVGGLKNECPEGNANAHNEMAREFQEETGVVTRWQDWNYFAQLTNENKYSLYCFYCVNNTYFDQVKSNTEEIVHKLSINFLINNQHLLVDKTLWLIIMAIDCKKNGWFFEIGEIN